MEEFKYLELESNVSKLTQLWKRIGYFKLKPRPLSHTVMWYDCIDIVANVREHGVGFPNDVFD